MNIFLEPNDIKVIRGLLKSQKIGFAFSVYLTLTFAACSIGSLIFAVTSPLSPIVILLGFGSAALTYFLARATRKTWKQVIQPLRSALRPGAEKTIMAGKLQSASLTGQGEVTYKIDSNLITTYPALLHNGLALLQEPLIAIDTLLQQNVSLHLFVMLDGRQLLLDVRYTVQKVDKNTSAHRVKSRTKILSGTLRYFFYTFGYLVLLFAVIFVVPIGIILGVFPLTLGYVILLRSEIKRQRINKKRHVPHEINGTLTEIITARARIEVMGQPSSGSDDTWFRIDGKAYLIIPNGPLPPIAVGDTIELEIG